MADVYTSDEHFKYGADEYWPGDTVVTQESQIAVVTANDIQILVDNGLMHLEQAE